MRRRILSFNPTIIPGMQRTANMGWPRIFAEVVAIVASTLLVLGCSEGEQSRSSTPATEPALGSLAKDHYSLANIHQFVTRHLHLDLTVDFSAKALHGSATLDMQRIDANATEIVLDTVDLTIERVAFVSDTSTRIEAEHHFGETDERLGTPLIITIPAEFRDSTNLTVYVEYRTSPGARALGWMPAELTAGGEHPLLYSQSQSINARSWVPLQDSPAVRITYSARIKTPPGLLAVMSASNDPNALRDGDYEFDMPQPIPSYLLAIAVGNLFFAEIGLHTGVYAEPELLDAAAFEFADTQAMFEIAEDMFGPYRWGRYDLLVLPPSFPYGGMENPRLSFVTPSLLAGDRSLVSVIAHELAHSWSGNLVTNKTIRDQWLNEGWTSYLEHRLMQVIYDEGRAAEENLLNYRELLSQLESVKPKYQALAPEIRHADLEYDPGTIHYQKGSLFLQYLENAYGRDFFDAFINDYFDAYAFQVITTEEFVDYLDNKLLSQHEGILSRTDVERWMYEPGLPDDAIIPTSDNLDRAAEFATLWSRGEIDTEQLPASDWSPQATIHFINSLGADLPPERLRELDAALALGDTRNAEIGRTWFIQVAKRRHEPGYSQLRDYLQRYGRTRLVLPIYVALAENGDDLALAVELFDEAKGKYHPLTIRSIERALDQVATE